MKSSDKKGLENILQAVENFIEPLLEKLKYDKTYRGKVVADKGSGLYSIQINGKEYDIQTESTSLIVNSIVKVKSPLNNFSDIYIESAGGGGGGTTDYTLLVNKPKINNVELVGNKSLNDLGIQPAGNYVVDADYVHTDNNYTNGDKQIVDSYTASDVLTKLLTVDGIGSGLDADLLDGLHSTSFVSQFSIPAGVGTARYFKIAELVTALGSNENGGIVYVNGGGDFGSNNMGLDVIQFSTRSSSFLRVKTLFNAGVTPYSYGYVVNATSGKTEIWISTSTYCYGATCYVGNNRAATIGNLSNQSTAPAGLVAVTPIIIGSNATGNIPLSNGTVNTNLNADKLDGQDGSYYQNADNLNAGTILDARMSKTSGYYSINPIVPPSGTVRANLGIPSLAEMALIDSEATNKLQFLLPIKIEKSATDDTTWINHQTPVNDNLVKNMLLGRNGTSGLSIPYSSYGLRFTFSTTNYVYLNWLYGYTSTNGHTCKAKIEVSNDLISWSNIVADSGQFNTWPGHIFLPHNTITWRPSPTNNWIYTRITFLPTWNGTYPSNPVNIYTLEWWGGYPSGNRELYTWDFDKVITFPSTIQATQVQSTIATGTAPLIVASNTLVSNLNADLLDGQHSTYYETNTNKVTSISALSTDIQYPSAKLLYDQLAPMKTNITSLLNERELTLEPTGFTNSDSITVSYNSTTRQVTLTGTFEAYYKGVLIPVLTNGWVSSAHTNVNGTYYLYYDGSAFQFSTTPWTYDKLQIAFVQYGTNNLAIRETHGFMQWQVHKEFHQNIGTYKESGGAVTGYVADSTTATNRRPDIGALVVYDEDLKTTINALTSKTYTQRYLVGSAVRTLITGATEILPVSGTQPYYNLNTNGTWSQALMASNDYAAIFVVGIPTTADTASQAYRYMFVQPQQVGTLEQISKLTPANLTLGDTAGFVSEFVFFTRIIVQYLGSDWKIINVSDVAANLITITQSTTTVHNSLSGLQGGTTGEFYHLTATQVTTVSNTSGTNTGDNSPNSLYSGLVTNATHTGEVTGSQALTITNKAVTNAKLADMVTKTYKGRTSASTGVPEDIPVATLKTDLSLNNVDNTSDLNKPISNATQTALNAKSVFIVVANNTDADTLNATGFYTGLFMIDLSNTGTKVAVNGNLIVQGTAQIFVQNTTLFYGMNVRIGNTGTGFNNWTKIVTKYDLDNFPYLIKHVYTTEVDPDNLYQEGFYCGTYTGLGKGSMLIQLTQDDNDLDYGLTQIFISMDNVLQTRAKYNMEESFEKGMDWTPWKFPLDSSHTTVVASATLGHIKSGTDITVDASGNVSVIDDSHDHTKLKRIDDRDRKPTDISKGYAETVFTSLGGMTGTADADYQDMFVLNTYSDSSGGKENALVFDKSEMKIRHYQAAQADTTWGTPKVIAYDDIVTISANGLMSSTDKVKLNGIATGAQVNNISDVNATDLTDGGASTLHYHTSDRDRANHTGTQLSSTISDFATTVRATVLTGLLTTTNAVITAADSILSALGKLQKQITDNLATLSGHISDVANPHGTTKSQVGLGNCDNTSDINKPISTATQTALTNLDNTIPIVDSQYFYSANGVKTSFDCYHGFASQLVFVQVTEVSTGRIVYPDITILSSDYVTITFSVAPVNSSQYHYMIAKFGKKNPLG
jgi:hypothetical protein